jgi:dTDP-4-amino-4,6-dideoxygalactose transaminase
LYPQAGRSLPETEKLVLRAIQLPTGTAIGEQDVADICEFIRFVVDNGRAISKRCNDLFQEQKDI